MFHVKLGYMEKAVISNVQSTALTKRVTVQQGRALDSARMGGMAINVIALASVIPVDVIDQRSIAPNVRLVGTGCIAIHPVRPIVATMDVTC